MLKWEVPVKVKKDKGYTVNHISGSQFLYLYKGHNKPLPCIAYFNDRTHGKSNLRGKGFVSVRGSGDYSSSWWRRH